MPKSFNSRNAIKSQNLQVNEPDACSGGKKVEKHR